MTIAPYIKSLISALQNRGGDGCHAVIDNPSDRIYRLLSWHFAAASAFVCTRRYSPSFPASYQRFVTGSDWNLIGTSLEPDWNLAEGLLR